MAYIGKTPIVGNFQKCDAITTSATDTFNLLVGGVAVSPETANHCIVSLNGVIQAPTSAFTISGSTIVFNSALTSADVIDFILLLGSVLNIGTPSDNVVSTAKIQDDAVTLAKMASGTDGNIISYDASGNPVAIATGNDGQVLTSAGAGQPPAFEAAAGGVNTPAFEATLASDQDIGTETLTKLAFATEVFDTAGEYDASSNYRFTPQTAGKYFVYCTAEMHESGDVRVNSNYTAIYKNGAVYRYAYHAMDTGVGNTHIGENFTCYVSTVIDMNGSSDYVECFGNLHFYEPGTGLVESASSVFGAYKLIE